MIRTAHLHRIAAAVVAAMVFVGTPAADANPIREPANAVALEHLRAGNRLLDLEKYDEAIAEYEKGALLDPVPVFWLNIGLAHRRAGRHQQSIRAYRTFLARIEGDPLGVGIRADVEQVISDLESIATRPPNEPAPRESTHAPAAGADEAHGRQLSIQPLPRDSEPRAAWYQDTMGWILTGSSLALGATSAILFTSATTLSDAANRESDHQESQRLRDRAGSRRIAGTVTAVGAGGLLVAAIVKFSLTSKRTDRGDLAGVRFGPGSSALSVSVAFDF